MSSTLGDFDKKKKSVERDFCTTRISSKTNRDNFFFSALRIVTNFNRVLKIATCNEKKKKTHDEACTRGRTAVPKVRHNKL